MNPLDAQGVERALRKTAALRALFRRLPHVPTPAEMRLLGQFEEFCARRSDHCTLDAARAGLRDAWRRRDYRAIADAGKRLSRDVVEADRTLLGYVSNAEEHGAAKRGGPRTP